MKNIIRAIASLVILLPALMTAGFILSLLNDTISRLLSGQAIAIGSLLWIPIGCLFIYQISRFVWKGWQQPTSVTPKLKTESDIRPQAPTEFKWTNLFKSIFKFLLVVFVGLPLLIIVLIGIFDLGSRLFGPISMPFTVLAIPVVLWLGGKGVRALKTSFEAKREALEQNKWQGGGKKTTRLEIAIRVILLIFLLPPFLIALQGVVLSLPNVINPPFQSAVAPDDVFGNVVLRVISLAIFLPFLVIFVGLSWLGYKLVSRLARVLTYLIGVQMEYRRLEDAMTTPAVTLDNDLSEFPEEERKSHQR
jgi:hypothetical protein